VKRDHHVENHEHHPREVDPDVLLVELDEVKVHAQAHTGRKQVLVLTALVMIAGRCWHLAAATTTELAYQVGALLAVLEVHRGTRRLLVLADGARWIREWFEGLGLSGSTMIVCWWHLVKRCGQYLIRACRGREHRREIESAVVRALWNGRVDEALEVLRAHSGEMKNVEALQELIGYLEARRPYLPDYAARQRAGLWIASNRVEKFNDWSVSARCKHQGMEWTEAGVVALAVLEAARRNRELANLEDQAQFTRLEGPQRPQEGRLSGARGRTDWRSAGKFFNRVNHDILMDRVVRRISDKRLLRLIRAYLNAGVMEDGLVSPTDEGVPQGGPHGSHLSEWFDPKPDRVDRKTAR